MSSATNWRNKNSMETGMWKRNTQHSRSILPLPHRFQGFIFFSLSSAVSIAANSRQVRALLPSFPSLCSWVLQSIKKFESLPVLHSFCWFCFLQAGLLMASVHFYASFAAKGLVSFEGLRPCSAKLASFGTYSVGLGNRSFRGLYVKAATVVAPKVCSVCSTCWFVCILCRPL